MKTWSVIAGLGVALSVANVGFADPPDEEDRSEVVDAVVAELEASAPPSRGDSIDVVKPTAPQIASGRLTLGARLSSDVQEYLVDGLLPLWRSDDRVLFLNVRGSFLEDREQELNAGLVARRLYRDAGVILGVNAFYDQRWTENDNRFDQVGGGLEVMTQWFDARFNYYYPLKDEVALDEFSDTVVSRSGNRRISTTTVYRQYEEALEGWDAEFGLWVPFLANTIPTALYAGYYDFSSDRAEDLSGWKARIESRLCSYTTLDAEWFENKELNRTDYFVGFRVHLPLDFWRGIHSAPAADPLEARMSDMVYRDFRIRTRVTDRVVVDQRQSATTVSAPAAPAAPTRPPPPPPPPPPNCFIDPITGDVICRN
ncbi:MAG TPA: inverse autotransporter beta domain-containing protein [Kiritimatiellia bacterium]|nr:inverse autotransporter beta domain-containing protein [Kiritimatiellia bacterium]